MLMFVSAHTSKTISPLTSYAWNYGDFTYPSHDG